MITSSDYRIVLSPIGEIDPGLFDLIGREFHRIFGYHTEIVELLEDVEFAYDPGRNQFHSTSILERLAGQAPDRAIRILAITRVDLFIPILTHVYGEAQLGGKACIVSTCRLTEGLNPVSAGEAYRFRVFKEAFHELGHTFKLRHCKDRSCIMHYCRGIKDVDRKSDQLCRYCKILLEDELRRISDNE